MYFATIEKCTSSECPRYKECYRAQRYAERSEKYYSRYSRCEWAHINENGEFDSGEYDMYLCGENGNWRMFLPMYKELLDEA